MSDRIVVRKEGHIAWLLFNRPERLNAMTFETWAEFDEQVLALDGDRDIRCLIVAGEGRAFLAGHDVGEIKSLNENIASGALPAAQLREWAVRLRSQLDALPVTGPTEAGAP